MPIFKRLKARLLTAKWLRPRQVVGFAVNVRDFPAIISVPSDPRDPAGIEME